jgi:hypothetical protein
MSHAVDNSSKPQDIKISFDAATKNFSVAIGRNFYTARVNDPNLAGKSTKQIVDFLKETLSQKEVYSEIKANRAHSYSVYSPKEGTNEGTITGQDINGKSVFVKNFAINEQSLKKIRDVYQRCLSPPQATIVLRPASQANVQSKNPSASQTDLAKDLLGSKKRDMINKSAPKVLEYDRRLKDFISKKQPLDEKERQELIVLAEQALKEVRALKPQAKSTIDMLMNFIGLEIKRLKMKSDSNVKHLFSMRTKSGVTALDFDPKAFRAFSSTQGSIKPATAAQKPPNSAAKKN